MMEDAAPSFTRIGGLDRHLQANAFRLYCDSVAQSRNQISTRMWIATMLGWWMGATGWTQSTGGDSFSTLLKQGFELHQQARFVEAISLLERARRLEPGDYFVNLLLGIDLLRTGKAVEAVPRLQLAARVRPGEEFPEDYLGEAEAALGQNALAAEAYQRAIERGHGSEQALEAWAGFALERFRALGESLRASAAGTAAARRMAEAATTPSAGLVCEGSIPLLEKRIALQPVGPNAVKLNVENTYKLSVCYAQAAGEVAAKLQTAAEDKAALHRLRGDVLLRLKGDATGAAAEYREALAVRSNDPALLERLAEAQLTAGDTQGAQESAQAALAIDPHRREALRTLASLAMNNRNYDQALPWLRQLAQETPGDRTAQVELAKALAQTGADKEAAGLLSPALASGYPDEKGALHALLGRALRKLGREAEAVKAEAEARRLSDAFQAQQTDGSHGSSDANQ
jgi:predicted Zn-dependent protease